MEPLENLNVHLLESRQKRKEDAYSVVNSSREWRLDRILCRSRKRAEKVFYNFTVSLLLLSGFSLSLLYYGVYLQLVYTHLSTWLLYIYTY